MVAPPLQGVDKTGGGQWRGKLSHAPPTPHVTPVQVCTRVALPVLVGECIPRDPIDSSLLTCRARVVCLLGRNQTGRISGGGVGRCKS